MADWEIRVPKPRPKCGPGTGGTKGMSGNREGNHHVIRKDPASQGTEIRQMSLSVRPGIMPGDGVEGK